MKLERLVRVAAAAVLVVSWAAPCSGQYFGQNKVQYKDLKFAVLKTEHFDIYYYPQERQGIEIAARMAERWHARLGRIFAHELRGRQPLVLYASHPDFEQTNAIAGELGEGTGGVTEPLRRRIVLPMGGPLADTDHVIGHELVHAYQFDITTPRNAQPGQNGAERLPLWFIEGMAEYLSLGPVDPNTAMWLRDAVRQDKLPNVDELDNPKYFPYRWGQAFWAYVGGRYGDDMIRRMLALAAAAGDYRVAIERVLGVKSQELSDDWHAAIRKTYEPTLEGTTPPSEIGHLVVKATGFATDLNVGPALSPDGRYLSFLSTRSIFSTDLFVADASTGKVIRRLTSTASDPHFSSIQFIYSAGAWDSEGKRIAIATVTGGHPALAIFDAEHGSKQRETSIPEVDEIFNPTWAPDDHAVCFTGMSQGLTDLYIYDLNASKLLRLTNDAYADIQPSWSPDGRRIAFATDRFTTDLNTLRIGSYALALIDPESGRIEQVRTSIPMGPTGPGGRAGFGAVGKSINPQWTPDGSALLFISDRDGIPNLYRVSIATGEVAQLTKVGTGLSGITSTSPALSVGSKTGTAAFSVYENGKYDIYTLPDIGAVTPSVGNAPLLPSIPVAALAAVLPPGDRRPSEVSGLLDSPTYGLPPATEYPSDDYKAKLSLEGLAQPTVAVGASRYGAALGGGIALQFGDMLGDQTLVTAVQLSSGITGNFDLKNTAAEVAYFNQAHRWNWGVIGAQVPYLSGGFLSAIGLVGNQPAEVDQTILFRQTEQSAAGVVAYPFNRAERVEFQGGITRISFDQIVQTTAFSLNTGQLLSNDTTTSAVAAPLTLGNSSAAFVYDTSNYGATSPVAGQRYRIEASPTFGSINYTGITADYRRYFMPVSFYTIAARILHYGRYGSGGDDARLFPLYIGYPNLVRGYDINTFDQSECVPNATSSCPAFDRLLGSRVLVGNLEFRFPLLRPFGQSQRMYGPVPVEVGIFTDGGIAWNSTSAIPAQGLLGTTTAPHPFRLRDGVASAGVTLRVNLLGFAVGQFDFAHPFERPGQGFVFEFNLSPGW